MEKVFSNVGVALCVTVFLSAPWAMFLGAEGMELFWASMFCGAALYVTSKRDFVSCPWAVVTGVVLSWWLLRTGIHLLPEDNALRYGSHQLGVSLRDMTRVRDFSFISTVCFFLAREVFEQRRTSEEKKRAQTPRYRAVRVPPSSSRH